MTTKFLVDLPSAPPLSPPPGPRVAPAVDPAADGKKRRGPRGPYKKKKRPRLGYADPREEEENEQKKQIEELKVAFM